MQYSQAIERPKSGARGSQHLGLESTPLAVKELERCSTPRKSCVLWSVSRKNLGRAIAWSEGITLVVRFRWPSMVCAVHSSSEAMDSGEHHNPTLRLLCGSSTVASHPVAPDSGSRRTHAPLRRRAPGSDSPNPGDSVLGDDGPSTHG